MLLSETKDVINSYFNSCAKIVNIDTYVETVYYDDCIPAQKKFFNESKAKIRFLELLSTIKGTKELIDKLDEGHRILTFKSKELSNHYPDSKLKDISSKINQFRKIYESTHKPIIDLVGNDLMYWCIR